jgi:hypothetical protein
MLHGGFGETRATPVRLVAESRGYRGNHIDVAGGALLGWSDIAFQEFMEMKLKDRLERAFDAS